MDYRQEVEEWESDESKPCAHAENVQCPVGDVYVEVVVGDLSKVH
jgi:hypothetical protein